MNNDIEDFKKWFKTKHPCDYTEDVTHDLISNEILKPYLARAWVAARKGYTKMQKHICKDCECKFEAPHNNLQTSVYGYRCISCAFNECESVARKGYIKFEDVEKILNDNTFHNEHMTALIAYGALAEIRDLGDKNDRG